MRTDPIGLLTELDEAVTPRPEFESALRRVLVVELDARPGSRRLRAALAFAAALLLLGGVATATYLAARRSAVAPPRRVPVENGPLTLIDGGRISILGFDGSPRTIFELRRRELGAPASVAWSPDGSRLAVSTDSFNVAQPVLGIHVVDVATRRDRLLPSSRLGCRTQRDLAWSPDDARIAFVCAGRINVVDADGSKVAVVPLRMTGRFSSPSWSLSGDRLVFGLRTGAGSSIYVVDLDGSDLRLLAAGATAPVWSPDGRRIAFRTGCGGIKLITPAGRDVTGAPPSRCPALGVPGVPIWSPDGKKIAIMVRHRRGIYVMDADGSHLTHVTTSVGEGIWGTGRPAWRPVPKTGRRSGGGL